MTMAETHPMNGGDGPLSYAHNSCYQREVVDAAKNLIIESIKDNLDIIGNNKPLCYPNTIRIADFGCSVGSNTLSTVQTIIQAVTLQFQNQIIKNPNNFPEFQVFFNDLPNNDFNTLFASLPPASAGQYFAAGVPGSFYARLFPEGTIHVGHASSAVSWLSRIPEELVDVKSPLWNKGRVHYSGSEEAYWAYSAQHRRDMEGFLRARATEIVEGGVMLISTPGCEDGLIPCHTAHSTLMGVLASCLMDLVKLGMVSEEKVDSFNLPVYMTSPKELREIVEKDGNFEVEKLEIMHPYQQGIPDLEILSLHSRAAFEGLMVQHFGNDEFMDELFDRYAKKMADNLYVFSEEYRKNEFVIFACLKRKALD